MKKFYLFLVALVVSAFAANAVGPENLYIVGSDFDSWEVSNKSYPMTKVSDGVFTYTPTTSNWFRIHDGSTVYGPGNSNVEFVNTDTYDKGFNLVVYTNNDKSFKSRANNVITVVFTSNTEAKIYNGEYTVGGNLYIHTKTTEWATTGTKMDAKDGKYEYTMDLDDVNYVVFTTTGTIDTGWTESCGFWGANASSAVDLKEGSNALKQGSKEAFKTESLTGNYTLTVDLAVGTLDVVKNGGEIVDPIDPIDPEEKEYTIYFVNKSNWSNVGVWAWTSGVNYTGGTWPGTKLEPVDGIKWIENSNLYDVYKFTFTGKANTSVIFNNYNNGSQTKEFTVKNNALYFSDNGELAEDAYTFTEKKSYTIYFANIGAQGWETADVEVADGNQTRKGNLVLTDNLYKTESGIYKVSVFTFDAYIPSGVIFKHDGNSSPQTGMHEFVNNALYITMGKYKDEGEYEWYEEAEPEMATIYLSLGADYMLAENKTAPVAVFSGNGVADYSVTMTATDEDYIFSAEFDKNKYSSVNFKVNSVDYPMNSETAKLHNDELAGENWFKYVYCTDGNDTEKWSTQSYLTYEEYVAHRDGERTGYRVAGSHNGWALDAENDWKPMNDGVCSFATSQMSVGTKFKISYIDPNQIRTNAADKAQRWWATFNLGIVGPDPYGEDVKQDGINQYVPYQVRVPKNYNHYCKYDWQVSEEGQFYVVIDPEHEVTVLLTFAPSPTLETTVNNLEKSNDVNEEPVSLPFEQHGVAQVREFNVANSVAQIKRSTKAEFREEYDVVYYLEADGEVIHVYDNLFTNATDDYATIDITDITGSNISTLSFYAQYTCKGIGDDKKGKDVVFNSRRTSVVISTDDLDLEKLEATDLADYCLVANGTDESGMLNWDAVFAVPFNYDGQQDYAWYPAFEDVVCNGVEAEIVHAEHPVLKRVVSGITINAEELHTVATDFTSYVHATNSWAEKARNAKKFYFYAENVAQTASRAEAANVELNFKGVLKAIYPFTSASQEPQAVRVRVAAQSDAPLFVFHSADSNFDYVVKAGSNLTSGVNDIELGEGEGEFELYNLQGVRVEGEAAPGLYIRRQGNKAEKIYIR